jgi:cytochrome b
MRFLRETAQFRGELYWSDIRTLQMSVTTRVSYLKASIMSMSRILVWDLPTRLFHWFLTVGLVACFAFAQLSGEHGTWFSAHMLVGIVLGLMLLMRVAWGIIGSKYARFDSFLFSPITVLNYVKGAITSQDRQYVGHNPGSSYGIFAMLFLLGMAVITGLMMSSGGDAAEELHAVSSYALMAVVAVHIVGVVWYSLRHQENITLSMFTGTKVGESADAIPSSRPTAALVFIAVVGFVTVSLFQNYDKTKGQTKLPLINIVIPLGESEGSEGQDND